LLFLDCASSFYRLVFCDCVVVNLRMVVVERLVLFTHTNRNIYLEQIVQINDTASQKCVTFRDSFPEHMPGLCLGMEYLPTLHLLKPVSELNAVHQLY